MTKEEKIKEAWAGFCINKVNENGWLDIKHQQYSNDELFDRLKFNSKKHSIRQKSLSGIENNNGWIKIENETDLPKEKGYFLCIYKDGEIVPHHFSINSEFDRDLFIGEFTYYQPIVKPKSPIY